MAKSVSLVGSIGSQRLSYTRPRAPRSRIRPRDGVRHKRAFAPTDHNDRGRPSTWAPERKTGFLRHRRSECRPRSRAAHGHERECEVVALVILFHRTGGVISEQRGPSNSVVFGHRRIENQQDAQPSGSGISWSRGRIRLLLSSAFAQPFRGDSGVFARSRGR